MLPIPYTSDPPGNWALPGGEKLWRFTKNVKRARRERDPKPPIITLPVALRPAIIFACEEALQDPIYDTITAIPLYRYKGSQGEAWARAMPNLFDVPAHTECKLNASGCGDFGRMFVFRKSWLQPQIARLFTTDHNDKNPICRLSDAMMQMVIDNFAVYLSKMAGLPLEESD